MDLLVLLAILWHRHSMMIRGLWNYSSHMSSSSDSIRMSQSPPQSPKLDNLEESSEEEEEEAGGEEEEKEEVKEEKKDVETLQEKTEQLELSESQSSSSNPVFQRVKMFLARYFGLILQRGEGKDYYAILFGFGKDFFFFK